MGFLSSTFLGTCVSIHLIISDFLIFFSFVFCLKPVDCVVYYYTSAPLFVSLCSSFVKLRVFFFPLCGCRAYLVFPGKHYVRMSSLLIVWTADVSSSNVLFVGISLTG